MPEEILMPEETEIGWLRLSDKTELVVTDRHVFHYANRGMFGENQTILPRHAITTVRLGWQRSRWLLVLGAILLILYLVILVVSFLPDGSNISFRNQNWNLSSSTTALIQYGSLLGGIVLIFLFWFDKQAQIQISGPSTTIGGLTKNYEEAQTFCALFAPCVRNQGPAGPRNAAEPSRETNPADSDWQL